MRKQDVKFLPKKSCSRLPLSFMSAHFSSPKFKSKRVSHGFLRFFTNLIFFILHHLPRTRPFKWSAWFYRSLFPANLMLFLLVLKAKSRFSENESIALRTENISVLPRIHSRTFSDKIELFRLPSKTKEMSIKLPNFFLILVFLRSPPLRFSKLAANKEAKSLILRAFSLVHWHRHVVRRI